VAGFPIIAYTRARKARNAKVRHLRHLRHYRLDFSSSTAAQSSGVWTMPSVLALMRLGSGLHRSLALISPAISYAPHRAVPHLGLTFGIPHAATPVASATRQARGLSTTGRQAAARKAETTSYFRLC